MKDATEQTIIRGRIEAFEFAANQFDIYADDIEALIARKYYNQRSMQGREKARALEQRRLAVELRNYANDQRKDLEA